MNPNGRRRVIFKWLFLALFQTPSYLIITWIPKSQLHCFIWCDSYRLYSEAFVCTVDHSFLPVTFLQFFLVSSDLPFGWTCAAIRASRRDTGRVLKLSKLAWTLRTLGPLQLETTLWVERRS